MSGKTSVIEWVPCRDRLPEEGKQVLVAIYGSDMIFLQPGEEIEDAIERVRKSIRRVTVGWVEESFWYDADGYAMVVTPTYWAELPAAPEDEEGE